jgi:hypothetical protein
MPVIVQPMGAVAGAPLPPPPSIATWAADLPTCVSGLESSLRVERSYKGKAAHDCGVPDQPPRLIPLLIPATLVPEHISALIPIGGSCPWRSTISWRPLIFRSTPTRL